MKQHDLNGGESTYQGDWTPARAISCTLETIVEEAIELLSFIDQPNYSTALYVVETKGE